MKESGLSKNQKEVEGLMFDGSNEYPENFALTMELRWKICTLRDILDLPPGRSNSIDQVPLFSFVQHLMYRKFFRGSSYSTRVLPKILHLIIAGRGNNG